MYRKPPHSTKFKPGISGNPNGRPRKLDEQDMASMIHQIMKLYATAKTGDHISRQKLIQLKDFLSK